jgi:hypothetical protein
VPTKWLHGDWGCSIWYRWATRRAARLHPQVSLVIASWADSPRPPAAVAAVSTMISKVKRFSATEIVVGDSPHQHRNPVDCLLAPKSTMRTCTSKARTSELETNAHVAAAAGKQHVGFVNTTGWFCARVSTSVFCPQVVNRTIAWLDLGHVTETYAVELSTPFRNAFRRELFR